MYMMQERLVREVDVFAATKRKVQKKRIAAKREAKKETEGKKLGEGGRIDLGMGLAVLDRAVDPPDHIDVLVLVVLQKVVCLPPQQQTKSAPHTPHPPEKERESERGHAQGADCRSASCGPVSSSIGRRNLAP